MRNSYIVTYDIRDDKRLRRVFKTMKDWGNHLQYSVFECELSATEFVEMRERLREILHLEEDQVLFIYLGPAASRGERVIESLGQPYVPFDAPCYIA
ncbi:MAG: CRISPR-associated endoribonuclease Cas2 [Pirellulaceae bacterium]|nr:MAG: CRISPR-associated endoribonuclease Cas2 [Pirellulaceae bacterium]